MKLNKPYTNKEYADLAVYCNDNGKVIEDKGDYLEAVNPPEKTIEQKEADVRAVRNSYLVKYVDPKQLVIVWNSLTETSQKEYTDYRQYLLDYPETEGWYEQNPMTFEEWKEKVDEPSEVVNE